MVVSPSKEGLRSIALRGEAGIGKSALCRVIARRAEEEGRAVYWAGSAGGTQAAGPLIALIEHVLLSSRARLAAVNPHVHAVLGAITAAATPAPDPEGPVSRHQLIGALCQLLRASSEGHESLIVLDDAQLADDATLDVLSHVAASVPDFGVVFAYRPEPIPETLSRAVDRLERAGRLLALDVEALSPPVARELARRTAGTELDGPVLERVADLGEGNPFAIIELARNASASAGGLPPTVNAAITARFLDLDSDAVRTLQRLALAGDEFDSVTAVALAGVEEDKTYGALDAALRRGILIVAGVRYRFRHALVRHALVEQMPPHQRRAAHASAAASLAGVGAAPGAVASQWLAAGNPAAAAPLLVQAAEQAMRIGAFSDARRYVDTVLQHEPQHPRALVISAEALDLLGDPGALRAYDAAIAVAAPDMVDDLVAMRALAQIKQGDPHGALSAIAGAQPRSVAGRLSYALAFAGAAALGATDAAVGTARAAECRRIALESGDRASIVIASWAQAAAAHARGELHESVMADLHDTKDLPHLAVRVFDGHLCMTQRFLYGARPYADVIAFADGIAREARRLDAARGVAFGVTLRGEAELLSGRLADAQADLTAAVGLHRATGGATGEAHALQRLAEVAWLSGEPRRARALVEEALGLARLTDIGFHLLDRIYGCRIALAEDVASAYAAVEEAEAAVQGPLETCPGCRITFAVPAAIASARAGMHEKAQLYASATDYLAQVVMRLPAWDAAEKEVHAHVAAARGDDSEARRLFTRAADGFARAGQPFDEQRCRAAASISGGGVG